MYFAPGGESIDTEKTWDCYLPEGCDWYDFWDSRVYAGGQTVTVPAPLDRVPLFVRAGSIIPMTENLQYADQRPSCPMELWVYSGADAYFELYEDSGDGYGYERGEYTITPLNWDDAQRVLTPLKEDMSLKLVMPK